MHLGVGSVQERCGGLGDSLLDYLYKPSRHVRTPREAMTGRVRRGGFMNVMPLLERRSFVRATYTPGLLPASPSYLASARSSGSIRQNHPSASPHLTHIDPKTGRARMVDVSHKDITQRSATAVGRIIIPEHAYKLVTGGSIDNAFGKAPVADAITPGSANSSATVGPLAPSASIPGRRGKPGKGDVLATAQLAGIMAAKRTADLIPLCHPLPITHVEVILEPSTSSSSSSANGTTDTHVINVYATVRTASRTGVEMEALTAANVALLTVWDMLKAVAGQEMMIERICVSRKEGGVSGLFERTDVL